MNRLNIVIVGHVDHGKSTLIGRLFHDTGSIPETKMGELRYIAQALQKPLDFALMMDNLREEREGGITIDTSQIPFKTEKREYIIIDAPGHREFTKNMLTGASQADAAVLVVDIEEGIKEQTRRHAYLLSLLGFKHVIVVINKMDKVNFSKEAYERFSSQVRYFLDEYKLGIWSMIGICATTGDGVASLSEHMPWEVQTLVEALDSVHIREYTYQPFRMAVQGNHEGPEGGTYALGQVLSGEAPVGADLAMLPEDRVVQLKEVFGGANKVKAGQPVAVVIEPFARSHHILCNWPLPRASVTLKANIYWMSKTPLEVGQELIIRCSTQYCSVRVFRITEKLDPGTGKFVRDNVSKVEEGEAAKLEILSSQPLVYEAFNELPELGRFTLTYGDETRAAGIFTE